MITCWMERTACSSLIEQSPQVSSLAWLFSSKHTPSTSLLVNRLILFPLPAHSAGSLCLAQEFSPNVSFVMCLPSQSSQRKYLRNYLISIVLSLRGFHCKRMPVTRCQMCLCQTVVVFLLIQYALQTSVKIKTVEVV